MANSNNKDGSVEQINAEAARLIEHIRCSNAPNEVLQTCSEKIRQAVEQLEPWLHQGTHSAAFLHEPMEDFVYESTDLTRSMPYSPVSGRRNPIAPAIKLRAENDKVLGEVEFSATYAGPPGCVHGGIIAAVFDELLSMANIANQVAGFTGSLTIRYHRPTPLHQPIELSAYCARTSGRKIVSKGEMRADGEITASAEGLFIMPAPEPAN